MIGKQGLYAALAAALGVNVGEVSTGRRGRKFKFNWPATRTTSRKPRNPADPAQAYLITRAEAKRARRAIKAQRDADRSWVKNPCTDDFY